MTATLPTSGRMGASVATGFGMPAVFLVTGVFYALGFTWTLFGMRPRPAHVQPSPPAATISPAQNRS